jgi:hypothetical protein
VKVKPGYILPPDWFLSCLAIKRRRKYYTTNKIYVNFKVALKSRAPPRNSGQALFLFAGQIDGSYEKFPAP